VYSENVSRKKNALVRIKLINATIRTAANPFLSTSLNEAEIFYPGTDFKPAYRLIG
jgi:hypothetical protein